MKRNTMTELFLLTLALAGCGEGSDEETGYTHEVVKSQLQRELAPQMTEDQWAALARSNHELTLDLYRQTVTPDANYMVSTLSVQAAFAMVYAGARGNTESEMADVLRFDRDQAAFHRAMNALDLALARRNRPAEGEEDAVQLLMANAFWGLSGHAWKEEYLDVLAVNYGAGIHSVNFDTEPETARAIINEWVEQQTRDRIRDLLPEGSINKDTAAVLTNAVYMKAPWASQFEAGNTRDEAFTLLGGSRVDVQMMHQESGFPYAEGEGWQALELPYRGGELSMLVLLPAAGQFPSFEDQLSADRFEEITDLLHPEQVNVAFPHFGFETDFALSDALRGLGMVEAFDSADLSGMSDSPLYISEAFHKTFIEVDEDGTEAAAATAVVVGYTSEPEPPPITRLFRADRPFFYAIRDMETGVLLFFGRVVDPT